MSISDIRDPTTAEVADAQTYTTFNIYKVIEGNYETLLKTNTFTRINCKQMLQRYLNRNTKLYLKDNTILIEASVEYNQHVGTDIIEVLIILGIDVNIKDIYGNTPLCVAAHNGHLNIVQFLVDKGADINIKSNQGFTPLYVAAHNGHLNIVQFLVDKGANINIKSNKGSTPLFVAAHNGHLNIVQFLVDNDADINIRTPDDRTPLYVAAHNGHLNIVQFLVDRGAITTFINNTNGKTALDIAREQNHTDIIRLLEHKDREDVSDKIEGVKITYNPLHKNPGGKKRTIKNPRNTAKKRKLNKKKTKSKNTRK